MLKRSLTILKLILTVGFDDDQLKNNNRIGCIIILINRNNLEKAEDRQHYDVRSRILGTAQTMIPSEGQTP